MNRRNRRRENESALRTKEKVEPSGGVTLVKDVPVTRRQPAGTHYTAGM